MNITELKKQKLLARKDGNPVKIAAIDNVLALIEMDELRQNKTLTPEEIDGKIKKVVSELKDSEESFVMANEKGQINKYDVAIQECQDKIVILKAFLPQQLSEKQTTLAVEQVIIEVGAESMKDMGKIMGAIKKDFGSMVDMGLVSKIVKEKLA